LRVITLARIAAVKNPKLWQDVAERLNSMSEVDLAWWGPVADENMERMVRDHQLSSRPGRFAGSTDDPGTVLSEASILFHPSDRESHGLSIIEAACVGLPVVCSDVVASVLPEELNVETFSVGNAEEAVEALQRVIGDYETYSGAAMRQAQKVREMFGIEKCAQTYITACEAAIASMA